MKLTFTYDRNKDVWCIKNYGKTSMNSKTPTKAYEGLSVAYGENPTDKEIDAFISSYITTNAIDIESRCDEYQQDWDFIAEAYVKRAEEVFGVSISYNVQAYLTLNDRCPYSISEKMFFVSVPAYSVRKTAMHELWHFYTWERFGAWEEKIGKQKYNDLKEALTVLLNVECKDLLPENITDVGYPQHQELRKDILAFWEKEKDIGKLWNHFAQQ